MIGPLSYLREVSTYTNDLSAREVEEGTFTDVHHTTSALTREREMEPESAVSGVYGRRQIDIAPSLALAELRPDTKRKETIRLSPAPGILLIGPSLRDQDGGFLLPATTALFKITAAQQA